MLTADALERRVAATVHGLAALVVLLLALPMIGGHLYVLDDLGRFHIPLRAFYAAALADGESFLWWPDVFSGFYAHGDGQAGMTHPLHLALYSWLPFTLVFALELVLPYALCHVGLTGLLRRLEFGPVPAALAAFVFSFSSWMLLRHVHVAAIAVIAHVPWMLWALDVTIAGRDAPTRERAGLALAAVLASQALFGSPQYMVVPAITGFALLALRMPAPSRLLPVAGAAALAATVAAVQILPTLDALMTSDRTNPTDAFIGSFSLSPLRLAELFSPFLSADQLEGANPWEFRVHANVLLTVAPAWVVARWSAIRHRRLAVIAFALAAIALLLALGEHGPLWHVLTSVPLLDRFRVPARYLLVFHLALVPLAAIAFEDVAHVVRSQRAVDFTAAQRLLVASPLLIGGLSILAHLLATAQGHEYADRLAPLAIATLGVLLVAGGTAAFALAASGRRSALAALLLVAVIDVGVTGLAMVWSGPRMTPDALTHSVAAPPVRAGERCLRSDSGGGTLAIRPWPNASGFVGLPPRLEVPLDTEIGRSLARVGAVWSDASGWTRVPVTTPVAWLVSRSIVAPATPSVLAETDLAHVVTSVESIELDGAPPGAVTGVTRTNGAFDFDLSGVRDSQLLVVSERYHDGWSATVDDNVGRVVRVNGDYIGVPLAHASRAVRLEFLPASYSVGRRVSWLGLMLFGMSAVALVFRRRR